MTDPITQARLKNDRLRDQAGKISDELREVVGEARWIEARDLLALAVNLAYRSGWNDRDASTAPPAPNPPPPS